MYACGPTVYNRIHIGNARPFVVFSLLKRFLEHEGYEVTFVANITDVNDKIYDAARAQGVPSQQLADEMTAHYIADTDGLEIGRPDHEPTGRRHGPGDHRPDSGPDRQGPRLRRRGRRLLPRAQRPVLRRALASRHRPDGPGRGHRGRLAEGGPARLRAVEGPEGGRGHRLGRALGHRPPGLAHRVLGDGRGAARRGLRHPRRRQRPDVPPPRERGRADPRRARRRARADLDAQRDAPDGGEKMSKSLGNIVGLPDGARRQRPRRADHALLQRATTASRCSTTTRRSRRRRARAAHPRGRAPAGRRPVARGSRAAEAALLRRARRRLRHAARRWPRSSTGCARPTSARTSAATTSRDARRAGLDNLLAPDEEGPPARVVALAEQRQAARADKDFAESDRLRDEIAAAGWVVRDVAGGYELVPSN